MLEGSVSGATVLTYVCSALFVETMSLWVREEEGKSRHLEIEHGSFGLP